MTLSYTTINHDVRKKLELSMHEYALADLIYHLSNNPESSYPGWCYASKVKLGQILDFSERTVHVLLNRLEKTKLVERHPETKHLRTTSRWYGTIVDNPEESSATLKKVQPVAEQSSVEGLKKVQPTDMIYITDNDIDKVVTKVTSKTEYGDTNVNKILDYLKTSLGLPSLDGSVKSNRQYAWLLLKASKTGLEGVKWLIDKASSDGWWRNHITSTRDLWNNKVKIVGVSRGSVKVYAMEN